VDWRRENHAPTTQQIRQMRTERVSINNGTAPLITGKVGFFYGWRAHKQALVSLQHVTYKESIEFVVTGSTDGRVRLWSSEGVLVGTFGLDLWHLKDPCSYIGDNPNYKTKLEQHAPPKEAKKEIWEEPSISGAEDAEELSAEDYERLIMDQRRLALLDKKKGKSSNPFSTILDRRLNLQEIVPVEPPLTQMKKQVAEERGGTAKSSTRPG